MKIAILTPTIAPLTSIGGLGDILEDLPKFLKNLGNEVFVITYDHQDKISKRPHEVIKKIEIKYQGSKFLFDVLVITSYSIHYTKLYEPTWPVVARNTFNIFNV